MEIYPKYEVTNLGRVRNKKTKYIKKHTINYRTGYHQVALQDDVRRRKDGTKIDRKHNVHVMVANEFCVNDDPIHKIVVAHDDNYKQNNSI